MFTCADEVVLDSEACNIDEQTLYQHIVGRGVP